MNTGKRILLIGGGHAHVTALRWLAKNPQDGLKLTLVNPGARAAYSGMVPGVVAGHYDRHEAELDLGPLCAQTGVAFVNGRVTGFSPHGGFAELASRDSVEFDFASIDIGITSGPEKAGDTNSILVKPMTGFLDEWERLKATFQPGTSFPSIAIIGGGLGGVELALAVRHYASQIAPGQAPGITIVDRAARILSESSRGLRTRMERELKRGGVAVRTQAEATRHEGGILHLSDGTSLEADFVLWAAGARPQDWLSQCRLANKDGFPIVDASLRSVSHPNIYVCGDVAHFQPHPLMKAGVYAVRQGPILMQNLVRAAKGDPQIEYKPQTDYLKLVSLGRRKAVAEKWGLCVSLPGLWGQKRWIDCSFIQDA